MYPKDPSSDSALILRLVHEQGLPHWSKFAIAFGLMGIAAACTAVSAYLVGSVVNQAYLHKNLEAIAALAALIVVIFSAKGFATYGHAVLLASISNRIIAENQKRMFDNLVVEGLGYFSDRHSSEFLMKVTGGARAAASVLGMVVTALGRDAMTLVGLVTVMVVQDPLLSIVGVLVMPPAILSVRTLMRRSRSIAQNEFAGSLAIFETLQETIRGFKIVKAFTLEAEMQRRMLESIKSVEVASNRMARVNNRSSPLMDALGGVSIALVLLYGGYSVIELGAQPGQFVSFITAFLLAYEPAKRIAKLNVTLTATLVPVRMLFEILDLKGTERPGNSRHLDRIADGVIEFQDVHFSYYQGIPVLDGLSFVAGPGRLTALVGPSGGGKTTAFSLLLRLYEPQRGVIRLDGEELSHFTHTSLRRQIAYVSQDVFLFRGSVLENIRFGNLGATSEDIVAASKAAYAHNFIVTLPHGYDTQIGESGAQLSGGQRQRIAIARALIRNAPIILLDEATSSLDNEIEAEVQAGLNTLRQGRTCLAIAHRLHTVREADCLYLIENGRVTECGTHDELVQADGRYASFSTAASRAHHNQPTDADLGTLTSEGSLDMTKRALKQELADKMARTHC